MWCRLRAGAGSVVGAVVVGSAAAGADGTETGNGLGAPGQRNLGSPAQQALCGEDGDPRGVVATVADRAEPQGGRDSR